MVERCDGAGGRQGRREERKEGERVCINVSRIPLGHGEISTEGSREREGGKEAGKEAGKRGERQRRKKKFDSS